MALQQSTGRPSIIFAPWLNVFNNDRLRITNDQNNASLDLFRGGVITFYHGGNSAIPLTLQTYEWNGNSGEYGFTFPLIRVTGGRMDLNPSGDKAEIRIRGANTSLGFYNTDTAKFFFRVNADSSSDFFGDIKVNGDRLAKINELPTVPGLATPSANGLMSSQDKTKLDGLGAGGTATLPTPVQLSVTSLNTLSALPVAPSVAGNIRITIDGVAEYAVGTNPSYTVTGTTVNWSAANAGYNLVPGMRVYAEIW